MPNDDIEFKCVRKPTKSNTNTPCKQIQPLSRIKTLDGPRVRGISPVRKEKAYGGKDLPKSKVFQNERLNEDESCESEDGEDDELPWVKVKETVSDEARTDQWVVRSIDKVQHTEKSD